MVPSVPVTPFPAWAGPGTGGQYCAHWPLQRDLPLVSGANQYNVRPCEFVSTVVPPMFCVPRFPLLAEVAEGPLTPVPPAPASAPANRPSATTETATTAGAA